MTTKEAAELMIEGLHHVDGTPSGMERAKALWAAGDYDGVRAIYEGFEDAMWRQTCKEKDEARGKYEHG